MTIHYTKNGEEKSTSAYMYRCFVIFHPPDVQITVNYIYKYKLNDIGGESGRVNGMRAHAYSAQGTSGTEEHIWMNGLRTITETICTGMPAHLFALSTQVFPVYAYPLVPVLAFLSTSTHQRSCRTESLSDSSQ